MEIGGYFQLELRNGNEFHSGALRLNTGRNAFEYILRAKKYSKVYLPYFTCEAMLEPIKKLNIDVEFYKLDPYFYPAFNIRKIKKGEIFLYTNYFGICTDICKKLSKYINNLIIDNSQAFFSKPIDGIDTFYSPRKFFGVPDGSYLYTDSKIDWKLDQDYSLDRFDDLIGRIEYSAEKFYEKHKQINSLLKNQPIKLMSNITKSILQGIDYDYVIFKRQNNYNYLHNILSGINCLNTSLNDNDVPLIYPLFVSNGIELKKILIKNKIYVATYWPNVKQWTEQTDYEHQLVDHLVCLPVDQRINYQNLDFIIELILLNTNTN
ncbi:hypothetical protein [Methylomarinum vadi]|uniref:hypothetical protein n=1 Tax=Methylomarinum vadi TaxID=438855 RepID=UPI0004DF2B4B|nr:hypothetical protein [Methylomarinum vadi]